MELVSKKDSNYNVIVTRPTNSMILTCDHSHDLLIWSWYVTYKLHPNINSYHSCHHSYIMTTSRPFICHTTTTSSHHHGTPRSLSKNLVWASSKVLWRPTKKTISRSTPVLESECGGSIKGKYTQLLDQEDHQGSYKWSGKRRWLAGRVLAWPFGTLISVWTISLYYLMSRGEGKVVTRECLVTTPSRRRSSVWPLDGPAAMSAEGIQTDDLYRAYQRLSL